MPKSTAQLLEQLYSKLNNVILPADLSAKTPATGFVTMMLPGITVTPKDFDTSTIEGKQNLFQLMDRIPSVNKHYVDSTKKTSQMYQLILSANVPEDDSANAKKIKERFDKASEYLDTNAYDTYIDYKFDYQDAREEYLFLLNQVPQDSSQVRKAERKMKQALDNWSVRGKKSLVEDALATVKKYLSYTPSAVFAAAGTAYETGIDDDTNSYPANCIPNSWATEPDKLSWTKVVIKEGSSVDKTHHEVNSVHSDFSGSFQYGLWSGSASGGFDKRTEEINKKSTVDKLGMSFEIARVEIIRPWFNTALLNYPDVYINKMKSGEICSGRLETADKCKFPFVPTSFVVARNIALYNEFSEDEYNFFNEATSWSASAKVGYGPFSIGSNTSATKNLTDEEKKEFGSAIKIDVGSQMQIIGFTNSVLMPAFPSADSPTKLSNNIDINNRIMQIINDNPDINP